MLIIIIKSVDLKFAKGRQEDHFVEHVGVSVVVLIEPVSHFYRADTGEQIALAMTAACVLEEFVKICRVLTRRSAENQPSEVREQP